MQDYLVGSGGAATLRLGAWKHVPVMSTEAQKVPEKSPLPLPEVLMRVTSRTFPTQESPEGLSVGTSQVFAGGGVLEAAA